MKLRVWVFFLVFLLSVAANASLILHLQAPYRTSAGQEDFVYHILGSAGGSYNPTYGATSPTMMQSEGDGWFVYKWDKEVSDFQDWQNFNIAATPNTDDQNFNNNNKVSWKEFGEPKVSEIFGSDKEIWIYTDASDYSYKKSYIAPGSKLVWFKSPWGNKALPQMVFGKDTVLMRFNVDDATTCGWFYGAIPPEMLARNASSKKVRFMRNRTPYMAWPDEDVDISSALSSSDNVYIDGFASKASVSAKMGSLGTCFDSTRVLHVYHPWRANTTYRDSALFISIGNNILNNPVRMDPDEYDRWWSYTFDNKTVNSSNWSSNGARVEFRRKENEWPPVYFFGDTDSLRPKISDWFPAGVYETWIYTKDNGTVDVLFSPLEPKYIRLKSPWDNMSPMMILPNDTIKMGPFSDDSATCGWYQGIVYKHTENWNMYVRQAFGMVYADARGVKDNNDNLQPFDLAEMATKYDTMYVMPTPTLTSPMKAFETFPNSPGNCPQLVLNVRVIDWAGEGVLLPGATSSQQSDFSIDVDFGGIYNGNDYTTVTYLDSTGTLVTNSKCGGRVLGMVNDYLYTDTILVHNADKPSGYDTLFYKIPTRVDSLDYPWGQCSAAHEIERWFIPDTVQGHLAATCYQIPMTLDEEGFWLVDISEDSPNGGFFPLDDFKYLDDEKTVWNPKYDSTCIEGKCHNFSFSMKISAQFQYVKGQYFEFRGDDDVWVFINNRLVVDIGGCHGPEEAGVFLDTIGQNDPSEKLVEGHTYSFYIFFSERNATGSNFKMRTSINLQTEKTYYWEETVDDNGVSSVSLLQRMIEKNMSCDEGSVAQAKVMPAPSLFMLKYPDGTSEKLSPGTYFDGITIGESSFSIDTAAISAAHERGEGLPAGNYTLQFCKEDLSECDAYSFVITVPQPTIVFADSLGNTIDPLTTQLGVFANVFYPVYVKVLYRGNNCYSDSLCLVELAMTSPDSLLSFYDESMSEIDRIFIQKVVVGEDTLGMAKFYVMSKNPVEDASFHVYDVENLVANDLLWTGIDLQKAPVPQLQQAYMFDLDGDGVGDSLSVAYDDMLKNDEKWVLDSIMWLFGDTTKHRIAAGNLNILDSMFYLKADSLYKNCFTGAIGEAYKGTLVSYYRYFSKNDTTGVVDTISLAPSGFISDRVPPLISRVVAEPMNDGKFMKLSIYITESLDSATVARDDLFDFKVHLDGADRSKDIRLIGVSSMPNGSILNWTFSRTNETDPVPSVGDSIRFAPGIARDMSGNLAHENNRWVRIEGKQVLRVDIVKDIALTNEVLEKDIPAFSMYIVSTEKPLADAYEEIGLPGFRIPFDMSELLLGDTTGMQPEDVEIVWDNSVFTSLGGYVNNGKGRISCADEMFGGDCRNSRGYVYVAWNGQSAKNRLVGTGAYIYKYMVRVRSNKSTVTSKDDTAVVGIRRKRN